MKKIISFAVCLFMLCLCIMPAAAESGDILEIKLQLGSDKLLIDGHTYPCQAPYTKNGVFFVPLRSVMEAYGAEVNFLGKGKVNIVYRDVMLDMLVGSADYSVNGAGKKLSSASEYVNTIAMVPSELVTENFGGRMAVAKDNKSFTFILEDDGAISDFSTVIGSISKPRIGNSYFGWSMSIPKGSQIVSTSFSSRDISVANQQRGIAIDVSVGVDRGKKLEDIVNDIKLQKKSYGMGGEKKVVDWSINDTAAPSYAEILANSHYKGSVLQRIYISGGYVYSLEISSYEEINPGRLKENVFCKSVVNSFSLGFKGDEKDVYDTSRVSGGTARLEDSVYGFSIDVFPEWDYINDRYLYDPYSLMVGSDMKEYMSISPLSVGKVEDMNKYIEEIKQGYSSNFNSKYYRFIKSEELELGGLKVNKLCYEIDFNGNRYVFEENLFMQGNVLFDIEIKCPESKYQTNKNKYNSMISSLRYSAKNSEEDISRIINSNEDSDSINRVGKNDDITNYEDKSGNWKLKLPGYWTASESYDEMSVTFGNSRSNIYMSVESIKNTAITRNLEDENKFRSVSYFTADKDKVKLVGKKTISQKGASIRNYTYRYQNDTDEVYADVEIYVMDGKDYSYCLYYMVPDLFASEKNVKEIQDIWSSFSFK
ncbi:copper amine oxidase-like protein [Anaerobacterium chartisolvens]|uniref:Copper amine oxidase-like protein n=1 Tax=Anaerobacterium chartisolvens TaxID=1297424 RepID=A0A369B699_9FIRM|nr:copper amine oxidase N-terminal domain-containing protein [Anaerobacterium chartisolvens]RCX16855.1 copper amine oxidase-like protein [Anaerobacterium chartisolvens]